jgi:hypothetical protein
VLCVRLTKLWRSLRCAVCGHGVQCSASNTGQLVAKLQCFPQGGNAEPACYCVAALGRCVMLQTVQGSPVGLACS